MELEGAKKLVGAKIRTIEAEIDAIIESVT
jgi:hypothetical protein